MLRIQYLSEHEKAQVQDFRNWVENDPELTTRSAPDSPIIGLIESSDAATCQEVGTSGTPKISAPEVDKSAPSSEQTSPSEATSDGTTATATTTSGEAGGSGKPGVRVVPFQSLPSSENSLMILCLLWITYRSLQTICNGASNSPRYVFSHQSSFISSSFDL